MSSRRKVGGTEKVQRNKFPDNHPCFNYYNPSILVSSSENYLGSMIVLKTYLSNEEWMEKITFREPKLILPVCKHNNQKCNYTKRKKLPKVLSLNKNSETGFLVSSFLVILCCYQVFFTTQCTPQVKGKKQTCH